MKKATNAVGKFCSKYTIVPIIVVVFAVFAICGSKFLTTNNLLNILHQGAIYGTMAIGMTFLIICGYFDLSAGVVMGLCANLVILLQINGLGIALSVIITLAVGFLIGLINGLLVTKAKVNAFIVTLAMMVAGRGLTYILCESDQISGPIREFSRYANGKLFGTVSYLTITFIVLLIIAALFLKFSKHGRKHIRYRRQHRSCL